MLDLTGLKDAPIKNALKNKAVKELYKDTQVTHGFIPATPKCEDSEHYFTVKTDSVKVSFIAGSKSSIDNNIKATTLLLEYPRFIHAEVMTHRALTRNASSSRAIPVNNAVTQTKTATAKLAFWGKNQGGMQSYQPLLGWRLFYSMKLWALGIFFVTWLSKALGKLGLHKQWANRWLETAQNIRVLVTATEWNNFLALRNHPAAQPEIHELAHCISAVMTAMANHYEELRPGEWHTPFVEHLRIDDKLVYYVIENDRVKQLSVEDALKISSSCAAQTSYRKLNATAQKALEIYNRLVEDKPVHASPFEHPCTPMAAPCAHSIVALGEGETHIDRRGNKWSGNFRGMVQYRQLVPDHDVPW